MAINAALVKAIRMALSPVVEGKARGERARKAAEDVLAAVTRAFEPAPKKAVRQFALRLRVLNPTTGIPVPTAPERGTVFETDFFVCTHFGNCLTEVRHCLERQGAKWPGGNRMRNGSVKEKHAGVHPFCSSGKCEQGNDLRRRCSYLPEDVWSKGRFRFFRDDTPKQRQAMKRHKAEHLDEARVELTPFEEVAAMTPDDPATKQ
jgi:hypothetical protein